MNKKTIISIVTPSYNRAAFIERAIQSAHNQNIENFEHIIIDGGSSDETLQILKKYPLLKVVSEPDRGVYDALNKGISISKGEIIGQLNTDDYYERDIFKQVADIFSINSSIDAVVGGARVFEMSPSGDERTVSVYHPVRFDEFVRRATVGVPIFNAWFFRKRVFDRIGLYSLDYPLIADRDFLLRCYLNKIKIVSIHSVFYHYCQHPDSLTINNNSDGRISIMMEVEHLAEDYLRSKLSDSVVKKYCMEWHDVTAIELLISLLRRGDLSNSLQVIWSAIKYNPKWPFIVAAQSPARIRVYLNKKKYASVR
jgi:glycosyltransferase involved in cell wall biosynthesis